MPIAVRHHSAMLGTRHEPASRGMEMMRFAEVFPNEKIVVTLSRQLG